MTEKLKLDLPLVLPDIADERDACVGRLTELLQAEGLELAHLVREDGSARLCLHYDPQRFSVSRVRDLAQAAGAKIGDRFHHESLRIDGMDCPTCATVIEHATLPFLKSLGLARLAEVHQFNGEPEAACSSAQQAASGSPDSEQFRELVRELCAPPVTPAAVQ